MNSINRYLIAGGVLIMMLLMMGITSPLAMPPNPDNYDRLLKNGGPLPYYLQNHNNLQTQGIESPAKFSGMAKTRAGSFNALAVLIKFSDKNSLVDPLKFDTLLFVNKQGTVRSYYNEVSYGQLDIVTVNLPSTAGWVTAPQTYAYYCNGLNGTGPYPQNTQKLCEDIVDLIDPSINFANYDNDGDGYVDALVLIHTGPGAEFTMSNNDIWSHQWVTSTVRMKDGVRIFPYCIQPEYWNTPGDMTCGVYCHELGHVFGLPDLYDTDTPRDSYGVGKWSLMGYGSWNGPTGLGNYPAHLDAWSRLQLNFATSTNVISNTTGVNIGQVETGGPIYRLWSSGGVGSEYFLVENRQKVGYDSYLPYGGLLVWHIDQTQSDNDNQWYPGLISFGHYLVALVQADGLFEMEKNTSVGNSGDPFPGNTLKTTFSNTTTPNSNSYAGDITYVGVSNISPSAATMTADFQVSLASNVEDNTDAIIPMHSLLSQNYPNPFNPSTSIRVDLVRGDKIKMTIFDILGRPIKELAQGYFSAGVYELMWDGTNDGGLSVPSGVYFCELNTSNDKEVRKMILLK